MLQSGDRDANEIISAVAIRWLKSSAANEAWIVQDDVGGEYSWR
jgi:hypothetical protein